MIVVRPAAAGDLDGLMALAGKTGTGLTTLPRHAPTLEAKIADSIKAFSHPTGLGERLKYFLVMEDLDTGDLIGTSAVVAGIGLDKPFYCYRLLHITQASNDPVMRIDTELLQLSNDFVGNTEVATLFLDPDHRRPGLGKLLAKSRYLLIAAHLDRFADRVFAEIRGWVDEHDNSPFWEAIGRQFFGMSFTEADAINGQGNSQFIADLMPKFPIYTVLLPETARAVIGKPHDGARPALKLLEQEGFHFSGAVDIFDAGPEVEVHKRGIWTVRSSETAPLSGTVEGTVGEGQYLAANPGLQNFRATLTNVVDTDGGLWMPDCAAKALDLATGDDFIYAPLDHTGRHAKSGK